MTEAAVSVGAELGIELLLREEIGLDASTVGSSLVQRAVARRMDKRGIKEIGAYLASLSREGGELQQLIEEVVVPETYFFREPEALLDFSARAAASTPRPNAAAPLRVLSVPCSTGEEPYSIAMALLNAGLEPDAIAIDAMDVSLEAVRRAHEGIYRGGSFRGETITWKRYFGETIRGWEIAQEVRALVTVVHGNLISTGFQPPRERYDVIFCRNLLIYFDVAAQSRALAMLASLLAPDGVLVVGSADSFAARRAGFEPLAGYERSFLFSLSKRARTTEAAAPASRVPSRPVRSVRPLHTVRALAAPPATKVVVAQIAAQMQSIAIARDAEEVRAVLAEVARLADEGRLIDAISRAESAVRDGITSAELFSLMGTTHAAIPDLVQAEACYRRALFLDPANEDALLHMALLLEQRGEAAQAGRYRTRARRALSFTSAVAT
jgi:chemotaxis protein methyltransferase WspC